MGGIGKLGLIHRHYWYLLCVKLMRNSRIALGTLLSALNGKEVQKEGYRHMYGRFLLLHSRN